MSEWEKFKEDLYIVPNLEGVYLLSEIASENGIIYVGRADNLSERLSQHPDSQNLCLARKDIKYFAYEANDNSWEREKELIGKYDPECNRT